jgi:hypothetical protein
VFYKNDNTIVDVLNICFSSQDMQTQNKIILAGNKTYNDLYQLLIDWGHNIDIEKDNLFEYKQV